MFDGLNLHIKLIILEQIAICLNQAHIGDFLAKVAGNISKVLAKTQPNPPRLIFSGLNDQWKNESFIFIFGEDFRHLFE
jgi:hypothetical protein